MFGVPHALEDHAARACRAALDMLAAAGTQPVGLGLGLDSGEVLLHGEARATAAERGGRIFGPCLQRAARIAAAGGAGRITATHRATAALARNRIRFAAAAALSLDPETPPLPLFRPTGANWPGAEGRPATEGEMVEREAELAALSAAISPVAQGSGRLVALVGEAGVGKSRLVREFLARALPEGWLAVMAAADPQSSDVAYSTVAALLRAYFELDEEVGGALGDRLGVALGWCSIGFRRPSHPGRCLLRVPAAWRASGG